MSFATRLPPVCGRRIHDRTACRRQTHRSEVARHAPQRIAHRDPRCGSHRPVRDRRRGRRATRARRWETPLGRRPVVAHRRAHPRGARVRVLRASLRRCVLTAAVAAHQAAIGADRARRTRRVRDPADRPRRPRGEVLGTAGRGDAVARDHHPQRRPLRRVQPAVRRGGDRARPRRLARGAARPRAGAHGARAPRPRRRVTRARGRRGAARPGRTRRRALVAGACPVVVGDGPGRRRRFRFMPEAPGAARRRGRLVGGRLRRPVGVLSGGRRPSGAGGPDPRLHAWTARHDAAVAGRRRRRRTPDARDLPRLTRRRGTRRSSDHLLPRGCPRGSGRRGGPRVRHARSRFALLRGHKPRIDSRRDRAYRRADRDLPAGRLSHRRAVP